MFLLTTSDRNEYHTNQCGCIGATGPERFERLPDSHRGRYLVLSHLIMTRVTAPLPPLFEGGPFFCYTTYLVVSVADFAINSDACCEGAWLRERGVS